MDIGSLLLGVALLLIVGFFVARPLLDQAGAAGREPTPADQLLFERERVLTALRDLDFDHATGKLLEDDYTALRQQLMAQGAAVLQQLDQLGATAAEAPAAPNVDDEIEQAIARRRTTAAPAAPRASVDAEIEAGIAARRTAPAAGASQAAPARRFCAQCGRAAQPDDKFCGGCGTALAAERRPARARR